MRGQPVYKLPSHQINIRRSSNGLGRGDVQPNMWFKSHLASQSGLTKRTGMLIKNECEHGRLPL